MRENVKNKDYYLNKFITKSCIRHHNKYDYSKVEYVNSITKVEVVCQLHGSFFVRPDAHIRKVGCPKCNGGIKDSYDTFFEKAVIKHNNKYDYSKSEYTNSNTKIIVICKSHGEFLITPKNHLSGQGCTKCAGVYKRTNSEFISESNLVHKNKYDYSKTNYKNNRDKVTIICPEHGEFNQNPKDHLSGHGCKNCLSSKGEMFLEDILTTLGLNYKRNHIFEGCNGISGGVLPFDFYLYDKNIVIEFDGIQHFKPVEIFGGKSVYDIQIKNDRIRDEWCSNNGIKLIRIKYNEVDSGLNILYNEISKNEIVSDLGSSQFSLNTFISYRNELIKYVSNNQNFILNHNIGKYDCDIFIKDKGVGFKLLGLWKHSELNVDKNYIRLAQLEYEKAGYRLIQIFEDTWRLKNHIVKSRIDNILGKSVNIWARKCEIKEVSVKESTDFINDGHIQGNVGSSYKIGLYNKGELVAIMTFGSLRKNLGQINKDNCWELMRFCSKRGINIIGGASKLFKHFIKKMDPSYVVSYADKCWSTKDNIYVKLGMKYVHESTQSYFYIIGDTRKGRFGYRKDILVSMGYDSNMSEHNICKSNGVFRIYDCGTIKYVYEK
jgi:hypothetical protein